MARASVVTQRQLNAALADQLQLPAGYNRSGRPMTLQAILGARPSHVQVTAELTSAQWTRLAILRIQGDRDYHLGLGGVGIVDGWQALAEIRSRSSVGNTLVRREQRVVQVTLNKLLPNHITGLPTRPKPGRAPKAAIRRPADSGGVGRDTTVFGIDANDDEDTVMSYLHRESHDVYPRFERRGFVVEKMQGADTTSHDLVNLVARKTEVKYITGAGHGSPGKFSGNRLTTLFSHRKIRATGDRTAFRGKIVHLASCNTAAQLGKTLVWAGCEAYFGYDSAFLFDHRLPNVSFDCDSEVDRGFANGWTAREVFSHVDAFAHARYRFLCRTLQFSLAANVLHNKENLRCPVQSHDWGSPRARL